MRCVRMGSRAADESAATEGARPDDGGQDDSGSEVDAWASSEDEEGLDSGAWDAHAAAWALRLPGRRRGRRIMPASTSTTERHNQPA